MDRLMALKELKTNNDLSLEVVNKSLGLTKSRVLDLLGLLDLPEEIKEDIRQKKLTEKHGRAMRQLLDKAEVLREVFNFIKDKKLTGEQTLELVQAVKSEPRFTIEESYNELKNLSSNKVKIKKEPKDLLINEYDRLLKTIRLLNLNNIKNNNPSSLKDKLFDVKNVIEDLLNRL